MAAGLLAAHRHSSDTTEIEVASAGFGPQGEPVIPEAARVMSEIGIDISGHRSRAVTAELMNAADLVITMTAAQAVEALTVFPGGWRRTYPLSELVRRGHHLGGPDPGQDLPAWLSGLSVGRSPAQLLGPQAPEDIKDPTGVPSEGIAAHATFSRPQSTSSPGGLMRRLPARPTKPEPVATTAR